MPPVMARLLYAGALLIAVPIELITFLLTLLPDAAVLVTAWLRRDEPRTHRGPAVIDADFTVVDQPDGRAAPRRRVAADPSVLYCRPARPDEMKTDTGKIKVSRRDSS